MSWRRFRVIFAHLPPESESKTAIRNATDLTALPEPDPDLHGPWSQPEYLLAAIFDRIGQLVYMQSDGKGKPPAPYPRPGVEAPKVRAINPAASAYLAYLAEHHGAAPPAGWAPEVG